IKHADTLNILIDLADLLIKLNQIERAEKLLKKGLEATFKDSIDEEIRNRLVHLSINLYKSQGKFDSDEIIPELERLLIEALASMESKGGANSLELIPYLEALASYYNKRNNLIVPTLLERICEIHKYNNSSFTDKIDSYLKLADSFQQIESEYS